MAYIGKPVEDRVPASYKRLLLDKLKEKNPQMELPEQIFLGMDERIIALFKKNKE